MELFELTPDNKKEISGLMNQMDKNIKYPLGEDRFEINHGSDYFAFFEKIGKIKSVLLGDKSNIEGIFTVVKRTISGKEINYLCDLKKKSGSKSNVMVKLTNYFFKNIYEPNELYYGIHMNDKLNKENKIVRLLSSYISKYSNIDSKKYISSNSILKIYSMNYDQLIQNKQLIEKCKGGYISVYNLVGIKDLILESTNAPMKLIHLDYSEKETSIEVKYKDCVFMFSTILGSELDLKLIKQNITTETTATVTNFGMEKIDFEFIKTGEI